MIQPTMEEPQAEKATMRAVSFWRYDVVFDTIATEQVWHWRRAVHRSGSVVNVIPVFGAPWLSRLAQLFTGYRPTGVFVQPSGADLAQLGAWVEAGKLRPIVERRYPLAEAVEAQRLSATKRVRGKLVLIVDEGLADLRSKS